MNYFLGSMLLCGSSMGLQAKGGKQSVVQPCLFSAMTPDTLSNTTDSIDQKSNELSKLDDLSSHVVLDGAYAFNQALKYHPLKADYLGTPVKNGRYHNPDYPFTLSFKDVRKWKKQTNPYLEFKKTDTFQLPIAADLAWLNNDSVDGVAWLGHATFFIRVGGVTLMTDPVFGNASRVLKRYSKFPVKPEQLPMINYVLLSHDHRDHMDYQSLRTLSKLNPNAEYLCGLSTSKLLKRFNRNGRIQEAGWYQQYQLDDQIIRITYLPTRHWCRRWITDTNRHLWGAFVIEVGGKVIYFGGDSGYGKHYAETKALFPNIDLAILGIGAYQPEWFMESNHSSPAKAYQSFLDLGAQHMVPMHYGTFDLSDEPIGEPAERLMQIA
ncbi:MAG: MBL fold metallo-hydrolase, partial [Bacteroidota bacterium]